MLATAHFYFYGRLQDFFKPALKGQWIPYPFWQAPAVKDAIEALGVPHVEVSAIICNGLPVPLRYNMQAGDQLEVYPFGIVGENGKEVIQPVRFQAVGHFILDVHLGALARTLRMLGIDALYQNDYDDHTIAQLATKENRAVLTRDIGLLKHKVVQHGYWLRSQHLQAQIKEVIEYFNLRQNLKPFSRCIACNGLLTEVPKDTVVKDLPLQTVKYYQEFYQCGACNKVYWKGSHYNNMLQTLQHLLLL